MIPLVAEGILGLGTALIDRLFPDKTKADEAKLKLLELQQSGELAALAADTELAKGQMAINQEEAKDESLFVKGWRPFIGWTCGSAFAFKYVIGPIGFTVAGFWGIKLQLPTLEMSEMMPILLGMLGLGGFRTYEKVKKVN